MMFLTQMSGTVLQSLRLIDTGGIIMKATIISAVSTGLIAGVFGIISVLITNYFTNKNQLTDLKTNLSRDHVDLSKEHTGLSKEHTALEKQLSAAQTRLDHLHDESIRMEGFRKDVEKQGIDVTAIKSNIDALVQKNGENITQVRDLTRDLEKSEQKLERSEEELVDVRKELQYYKEELAQSQRENQQLKQQIYNLQHPQQSWDEPER